MATLLILGGSNSQLNAVLRAKAKGHTVIVADYFKNAPGKRFSDFSELVSTFDANGCLDAARKHNIDGIMTVGTDQPVLTCAKVANELNIPSLLDVETARAATHKKVMKSIFKSSNIPSAEYRIIKQDFAEDELQGLRFPLVIKPLDSQGQRGVYKVSSMEEIQSLMPSVLSFSRENEILVEEFYESEEITLSGWVKDNTVHILTVTDRKTISNYPHIGICIAHNFPSKHLINYFTEIKELTDKIVNAFGIKNGPIYFQMLIGSDGIKVNEIACRIGGAYEDELIPAITGVDILDMLIDYTSGQRVNYSALEAYNLKTNTNYATVQMLFTKPGTVGMLTPMNKILTLPGIIAGRFNYHEGSIVEEIQNATQRVGYMIIQNNSYESLRHSVRQALEKIEIKDVKGEDMMIDFLHMFKN